MWASASASGGPGRSSLTRLGLVVHAATLALVALVLVSAGQPVFSEDTWLRLSLGEAYSAAGPWLSEDPLLHTAIGPPAPAAWLSDVALYGVEHVFGFAGLRSFHVLGVVAILALAWSLLRRTSGSPLLASLGTGVFAVLSAYRLFQLRPHLVSMFLALLLVRILVVDERPPSRQRIFVVVVLFALWANAHAGFVLGPVLLGAAAVGAGIVALARGDSTDRARSARIGLAVVLGLGATLLNPEGIGSHLLYLNAGGDTPALAVVIDEWASVSLWRLPPANLPPSLLSWGIVWILLLITPVAAVREFRAWRSGGGADPALAALAIVSLVGLLSAVRLLWLGIFPLLFLGHCARAHGILAKRSRLVPALIAVFALLLLPAFVWLGDWPMISRGVQRARYAEPYPATKSYAHAVWFLRDAQLEGRLFNGYEVGNFLGYWLAPRMKVFVNGSLNVPREAMEARKQIERRLGATSKESFTDTLDRLGIDVFFATGLPVTSPPNRPSIHTTTHLEGAPGWLLVFRTPRSAVYLRDNLRNRANRERVADYYARHGVPFDPERGLEVERVARAAPAWAADHGVLPMHLPRLEAAADSLDPARRKVAREQLGALYATLGLYERAISIERARLRAEPQASTAAPRLLWSLLHLGRFGEAREVASTLAGQPGSGDGLSQALVAVALSAERSQEDLAARVAVLPVFAGARARGVLAGFREPVARKTAR